MNFARNGEITDFTGISSPYERPVSPDLIIDTENETIEQSTNKIQGALVDVLSMIAGKRGLDLVLAKSQVLLVGKEIDITDQAIQELNKVLPKISFKKE